MNDSIHGQSDRDELARALYELNPAIREDSWHGDAHDFDAKPARVKADHARALVEVVWAAGWRKKPSVSGLAAILDSATAMLCPRCGLQVPTEREWEETPEGEGREMCWDAPGCIQSDYGRLDIARAAAVLALMDGPTETGESK